MSAIEQVFPNRKIRIKNTGFTGGIGLVFAVIVCVLIAVFMIWDQGPGLLRDYKIMQNPVVDEKASLSNGSCRTRQVIMTTCKADINFNDGTAGKQHVDFMFMDFNSGGYDVEIVRSAEDPSLMTLDLGIDKFWDRVFFFVLMNALLLGGALVLVINMIKTSRLNKILKASHNLQPVMVTVTNLQKNYGIRNAFYSYKDAKGKDRKRATRLKKKEEPFFIEGSEPQALAVLAQGMDVPVLLDAELSRLDLTAEEKAKIYAALSAAN